MTETREGGVLFVVGTPIGNLGDITHRAVQVLKEVDLVAAEDTRRAKILFQKYDIHTPLTSYHGHNEKWKSRELLDRIRKGDRVALISEAGMPGISDPGETIVRAAVQAEIRVVPVPGPTAGVTVLAVSGLPTGSFLFEGFLPRKRGKRLALLAELGEQGRTVVLYESPQRIHRTIQEIREVLGDREIVLGREVTKTFEEFLRGTCGEILSRIEGRPLKGEIVLLIRGKNRIPSPDQNP
jgi:16S rRNA (cytidine1402-2'-O)-methyltransferase